MCVLPKGHPPERLLNCFQKRCWQLVLKFVLERPSLATIACEFAFFSSHSLDFAKREMSFGLYAHPVPTNPSFPAFRPWLGDLNFFLFSPWIVFILSFTNLQSIYCRLGRLYSSNWLHSLVTRVTLSLLVVFASFPSLIYGSLSRHLFNRPACF